MTANNDKPTEAPGELALPRPMCSGGKLRCCVYIIDLGDSYKIGMAENPFARLATFRTVCPKASILSLFQFACRRDASHVEIYLKQVLNNARLGNEVFIGSEVIANIFLTTSQARLLWCAMNFKPLTHISHYAWDLISPNQEVSHDA